MSSPERREHEVVWHELECAPYRADLALWLELAARGRGPVLDIGAGSGRVAHALARAGLAVTALERDGRLLDASRARAGGLPIEHVCADARSFSLVRRDFALCIVPMHTIQLFGSSERRAAFLRRAHAHLRPRGVLACTVLFEAEPFDCRDGAPAAASESVRVDGLEFISTPVSVTIEEHAIVIERERRVMSASVVVHAEHDVVELARMLPQEFAAELLQVGFALQASRSVPSTDEHVGSEVVLARA